MSRSWAPFLVGCGAKETLLVFLLYQLFGAMFGPYNEVGFGRQGVYKGKQDNDKDVTVGAVSCGHVEHTCSIEDVTILDGSYVNEIAYKRSIFVDIEKW